MQLKLSAASRAALAARNLTIHGYQPIALFREARKLVLVPIPSDPWRVTIHRKGMAAWQEGARVGYATADTLDEAVRLALGGGDALGAMKRLEVALDDLAAVLRA